MDCSRHLIVDDASLSNVGGRRGAGAFVPFLHFICTLEIALRFLCAKVVLDRGCCQKKKVCSYFLREVSVR